MEPGRARREELELKKVNNTAPLPAVGFGFGLSQELDSDLCGSFPVWDILPFHGSMIQGSPISPSALPAPRETGLPPIQTEHFETTLAPA